MSFHAHFHQVISKFFRHALGERGYQTAFAFIYPHLNLEQQVVNGLSLSPDAAWAVIAQNAGCSAEGQTASGQAEV